MNTYLPPLAYTPPARPVGGIDYAKLEALRGSLELKRAGLRGALQLLHETREDHQIESQGVQLGMSTAGHQMWTTGDMADLLAWPANQLADGRVDVAAVRRCLALKDRCRRVQAQVDTLHAEMAPMSALVAACDRYIQQQQGL